MQFRIICSKMCTLCINYKRRLHCIWLTVRNIVLPINLDFRIKAGILHDVIVDQEITMWEWSCDDWTWENCPYKSCLLLFIVIYILLFSLLVKKTNSQLLACILYVSFGYLDSALVVSWLVAQVMYFSDARWIRGHFSFFLRCTTVLHWNHSIWHASCT